MLVARTTIGSAPRTTLIWVRVGELGFKRRSRPPKSMDEDPFTCFTRRRIDVRKRSKPSILTTPSGTHLSVTIYQRY